MSTGQAIALGVAVVAVLASVAVFTLAWRREQGSKTVGRLDRETKKAERRRPQLTLVGGAAAAPAPAEEPAEEASLEPTPEPRVIEVSAAELGETRRQFLNRATGVSFGAFLAFFGITSLAFLWPKLSGGFGGKIDAGNISDISDAIFQPDGSIEPYYVAEARAYVVPIDEALLAGTAFEGIEVVTQGLAALWQKCVHLGCRVPWCESSQGFECPCHGSKYNYHGEYEAGPAPRNLDRFTVEDTGGRLIINTGVVIDTPRSTVRTVPYPQGVNCL